jgi:hypothetical protein
MDLVIKRNLVIKCVLCDKNVIVTQIYKEMAL